MNQKKEMKNYTKILKDLDKFRDKDFTFASGRILGSMCTQPHPIAKEAYMNFLETNLGDPELFPGTREIESRFIKLVSDLLHAPTNSAGQNVSCVDAKAIEDKISNKTAAVVGLAGSTELGTIDPIPELSDICLDENIFLHVDAAFGGFIIPFLKKLNYNVTDFDFKLKGVSTISIDAHKMGYSAIPLGTLMMRDNKWLDEISVESPYISSNKQAGLLGTRSGGPVAAAYAVSRLLGLEGYKNLVQRCMDTTKYTEKRLEEIGLSLAIKPTMNVLGVKLKNLTKVTNKLFEYGWRVNKIDRISCIRIVLMPHVKKEIIDEFIPDLEKACMEVGEL